MGVNQALHQSSVGYKKILNRILWGFFRIWFFRKRAKKACVTRNVATDIAMWIPLELTFRKMLCRWAAYHFRHSVIRGFHILQFEAFHQISVPTLFGCPCSILKLIGSRHGWQRYTTKTEFSRWNISFLSPRSPMYVCSTSIRESGLGCLLIEM